MKFVLLWLCNVGFAGVANILMKGAWYPFLIPVAFLFNSISYFTLYLLYRDKEEMFALQVLMSSSQIVFGTVAGLYIFEEQGTPLKFAAVTLAVSAVLLMAYEIHLEKENVLIPNVDIDSPI